MTGRPSFSSVVAEVAYLHRIFPRWRIQWTTQQGWVAHRDGVPGVVVRATAWELEAALRRIDRWRAGSP